MEEARPTERSWLIELSPGEARLRCSYVRRRKTIEYLTVQLEIRIGDQWVAVIRYDNAHGFCHRDVLHLDGRQDKVQVFVGDVNATFTFAIEDLRVHWEGHRVRFLGEKKP
jgi:hypothetical protein